MSQEYMGSETLPPDRYLGPRRYKIDCRCLRCGNEYSYITEKLGGKDRACPKKACKEAKLKERWEHEQANMNRIIETGVAPGHIGENPTVKAIDKTAEIVMHDHGMTDLKDNIRQGESMAPKLPPAQQKVADNFFSANPLRDRGVGSRQAELLKRRAIAGAFRNMATSPRIVGGETGQSPLRHVRTEKF